MHKPSFDITPAGYPFIGLSALFSLSFACLDWDILTILCLVLTAFVVYFFRDPERVPPMDSEAAVSPADGKIIRIAERDDPITGEDRVCISIFMNVFSVHVNRSPIQGKVTNVTYVPGTFVNASWDKASRDNERCIWQVQDKQKLDWTFVQIAGLLARRIAPWAEVGDKLDRGERFGLIRFGSRVDLYLPKGYYAAVGIGDTVFAGHSVIAQKSSE